MHDINLLEISIYSLACFRLALMLSSDQGPWAVFSKLRSFLTREAERNKALRKSKVHVGITCRRCSSVWFGLLVAPYAYFHDQFWPWLATTGDVALLALALSAASILIERALPTTG